MMTEMGFTDHAKNVAELRAMKGRRHMDISLSQP